MKERGYFSDPTGNRAVSHGSRDRSSGESNYLVTSLSRKDVNHIVYLYNQRAEIRLKRKERKMEARR